MNHLIMLVGFKRTHTQTQAGSHFKNLAKRLPLIVQIYLLIVDQ